MTATAELLQGATVKKAAGSAQAPYSLAALEFGHT